MLGISLLPYAQSNNFKRTPTAMKKQDSKINPAFRAREASRIIDELFLYTTKGKIIYTYAQDLEKGTKSVQILSTDSKKNLRAQNLIREVVDKINSGEISLTVFCGNVLHIKNPNPKDGIHNGFRLTISSGHIVQEKSFDMGPLPQVLSIKG